MQKIANDKVGLIIFILFKDKRKKYTGTMNSVVMCGAEEKTMNKSEDNLKNPAM